MRARNVVLLFGCLVVAGALLASCSKSANAGSSAYSKSSPTVTIRVWGDALNQTLIQKPFEDMNAAFEQQYPNIKVNFDISQTNDTLQVAIQSNSLPDAFMDQGNKSPVLAQLARKSYLTDLDGKIDNLNRYSQQELGYSQVDGKLYSSPPAFLDTCLVYYNKDIFQKEGLSVPKTWSDFLALNDKLLADHITPISYSASSAWDNLWPFEILAPDFANDALTNMEQGKGTWDDPTIVQAFDNFRLLASKGYFGKNYVGVNESSMQLAFTNGKTAMIIDGTWNNKLYSAASFPLGHFFIPNDKGESIAQASLNNEDTYAVPANTKYPAQATLYVNFLASQNAQQIMENDLGLVPTLKDITANDASVKEMSTFTSLGWNVYQVASDLASDTAKPNDVLLNQVIPQVVTGQMTSKQAVDALDKASTYPKK